MFRTIECSLSREDWNNELIFSFGKCQIDSSIPSEYVYNIPNSKFVNAEKLCSMIDAKMFENGLTFVADEGVGKKDGLALQKIQMYVMSEYYKNYFSASTPFEPSTTIRNLLGGLKDPSRCLSQMNNMPWLLRFPLADKLGDMGICLPVLIVMPGPSFNTIKKHLKSLSRRFLVICISRSLRHCLDAGVEPDFVVQYDTHWEQRHFYDTIERLEKTVLISLSSASVSGFVWKFRGVFFRAAFNQMFLENPYILRDGNESSLLACMGLAEVLGAPEVLIAGADLSWSAKNGRYCSEDCMANPETTMTEDFRILQDSCGIRIVDRSGKKVVSNLSYVAAAVRASEFARDIQSNVGTRFSLTSNDGIMSPTEFPTAPLDAMLEAPLIDRGAYWEKVDEAINKKENVKLEAAMQYFNERANFLSVQELNFRIRKHNPGFQFDFYNEFVSLMQNIRSFMLPAMDNDDHVHNFMKQWAHAYKYAAKIGLAYLIAKKESLPVLCIGSEYDKIQESVDGFFPKESLELIVVSCFSSPEKSQREVIEDTRLGEWLKGKKMVFVSLAILNRYRYLFDILGDDNIIPLPPL